MGERKSYGLELRERTKEKSGNDRKKQVATFCPPMPILHIVDEMKFPMKRIYAVFATFLLLWVAGSPVFAAPSLVSTNPNYVAEIIYGEGASFRGAPTSTVPKGRQYCTTDKSMATDADKQEAFTEMAKVVIARQACNLRVGDGVGTARPKDGSTEQGPGAKSSWRMAKKAQEDANRWWDNLTDKEKKAQCTGGSLYFYHKCYCCEPDNKDGSYANVIGHAEEHDFEVSEMAMGDCERSPNAKGCPTSGHVKAASYKKVDCPGCPYFDEPSFWANKPQAPRTVSGEDMNDTLSGCWTEIVFLGGGR